jgi:hypothetical protein
VTPRRLRHPWARPGETGPNPINQPTARPTWRWVVPRLEGIHRVRVSVPGQVHDLIAGLHEVQITILRLCGEEGCRLEVMKVLFRGEQGVALEFFDERGALDSEDLGRFILNTIGLLESFCNQLPLKLFHSDIQAETFPGDLHRRL